MEGPLNVPTCDLDFKDAPVLPSRDLFDSVRQRGIVNPLIATQKNGRLRVYVGNQRLAVARILGLLEVPVVVVQTKAEVRKAFATYS